MFDKVYFNTKLPIEEQQRIGNALSKFTLQDHCWVATSGTTQAQKWVALSKKALVASAEAVNLHLQSTSKDIWLHSLPDFHVGGIGIRVRAALSGASVVDFKSKSSKWDPELFRMVANHTQATLTSLVPTQVYDLVAKGLHAPHSLRAIIVGGGDLSPKIYEEAVRLGWKLLPSYGLTECSSQVATAGLDTLESNQFPSLIPLSHIQLKINSEGLLTIKSSSLLTGYVIESEPNKFQWVDPIDEGWFQTEDLAQIESSGLTITGRGSSYIKIGGEGVNVNELRKVFEALRLKMGIVDDMLLMAIPDMRLGHTIQLITTTTDVDKLIKDYNNQVLPFCRIRQVHTFESIPRNALQKPIMSEILAQCTRGA